MTRMRTAKSYTMLLDAPLDEVFPLLCPVREYEWIQPWRCELVYTQSGRAELDCVFKTNFEDDGPEDVWVVSRYEPPTLIEFVRVNALRTIRYSINLHPLDGGRTSATWSQVITALNAEGDEIVARYSDEAHQGEMKTLSRMLNHFLKTGAMLTDSE